MNKVILCGRLVRDPEVRYSQGANVMAIARFSIAVDRQFKKDGEPNADFINCIAFGKTAETIEKMVAKGTKLLIEGKWQTGSYTNKDNQKVYTNDCLVERFEFCESKGSSNAAPQSSPVSSDGFMNIPDGIDAELPFN